MCACYQVLTECTCQTLISSVGWVTCGEDGFLLFCSNFISNYLKRFFLLQEKNIFLAKMDKQHFRVKFLQRPAGVVAAVQPVPGTYYVLFLFTGSVTDKPPGPPNSGRKGELRSAVGLQECENMKETKRECKFNNVSWVFSHVLCKAYICAEQKGAWLMFSINR